MPHSNSFVLASTTFVPEDAELAQKIAQLEMEQAVPSEAELESCRAQRDGEWTQLRELTPVTPVFAQRDHPLQIRQARERVLEPPGSRRWPTPSNKTFIAPMTWRTACVAKRIASPSDAARGGARHQCRTSGTVGRPTWRRPSRVARPCRPILGGALAADGHRAAVAA